MPQVKLSALPPDARRKVLERLHAEWVKNGSQDPIDWHDLETNGVAESTRLRLEARAEQGLNP